jgi:hypothetical protein
MAHEYETVLPDEVRELLGALTVSGLDVVDWGEDAESYEPPVRPPWQESWLVERRLANGRWAHVTSIRMGDTEREALHAAFQAGFLGVEMGRSWRVREVGDIAFSRASGTR